MPRRDVHVPVGQLFGIMGAVLATEGRTSNYNLAALAGGFLGGTVGGRLPDILEPAASPNHRAFFHSMTCNGSVVVFGREALLARIKKLVDEAHEMPLPKDGTINWQKVIAFFVAGLVAGFFAGYGSHILLDGFLGKTSLPLC